MKKSIVSIGVLCILFVALFVFLSSCHGAGAYEEKSFSVDQEFSILIIDADTENISFVVSNNEKCSVVSIERERVYHTVTNEGGKLTVKTVDDRRWYEKFGISYDNRITVYLPRSISTSVIINADLTKKQNIFSRTYFRCHIFIVEFKQSAHFLSSALWTIGQ